MRRSLVVLLAPLAQLAPVFWAAPARAEVETGRLEELSAEAGQAVRYRLATRVTPDGHAGSRGGVTPDGHAAPHVRRRRRTACTFSSRSRIGVGRSIGTDEPFTPSRPSLVRARNERLIDFCFGSGRLNGAQRCHVG